MAMPYRKPAYTAKQREKNLKMKGNETFIHANTFTFSQDTANATT